MAETRLSRRSFLATTAGIAAIGAASPLLAGCAPGGGNKSAPSGTIKFWDTNWGNNSYPSVGQDIVSRWKTKNWDATYQSISWNGWYQTFTSALAGKTNPAVSSGGATQVFQFYSEGQILPADNIHATLQKNGKLADYPSNAWEFLKYEGAYIGVPWALDLRVYGYRPSILHKAGVAPPTNWDELQKVGLKLKNIGVSGFGVDPTPAASNYLQFTAFLLSNDAPLIRAGGEIGALNPNFVEGVDFLIGLAKDGIIRKDMVSYTSADLFADISAGHTAISIVNSGDNTSLTAAAQADFDVMHPVAGPSGLTTTGGGIQSLMMYKNTPSPAASEEFLLWYIDNMQPYWQRAVCIVDPIRKSFAPILERSAPFMYKAVEYYPSFADELGTTYSQFSARYDASPAMTTWAQSIVLGNDTARNVCEKLQQALEQIGTA